MIGDAFAVEQHGESPADFLHPRLNGGKRSKRDDEDAGVEVCKFCLARAQLCGMFPAGDSTQVAEKNQQNVMVVFQHIAEGDGLAFGAL